jgi:hypothetical protein
LALAEEIQHFHLLQAQVEAAALLVQRGFLAVQVAVAMVKLSHLLLVAPVIPHLPLRHKEMMAVMAAVLLVMLLVGVAALVLLRQIVPAVKRMEGLAVVELFPHCLVLVFITLAVAAVQEMLVMEVQAA